VNLYNSSLLTQELKISEIVPQGSYVVDFFAAFDKVAETGWYSSDAYFRNVDQSDPKIQHQMEDFVNDLVDKVDAIKEQPRFFWLRDFQYFLTMDDRLLDLSFSEQLDIFLGVPAFEFLYKDHIVRHPDDGSILSSRVVLYMNINQEIVSDQVNALNQQEYVTSIQDINNNMYQQQGESDDVNNVVNDRYEKNNKEEYDFFTYGEQYYYWEFFSVTQTELVQTTITSISAVCVLSLFFMPHWSAVLFISPIMLMLYIDILGVMHIAGLSINAVTYLALIMSIGLLVDFLMHYLLRYYESREKTRTKKVKDALKSMGVSILLGGFSTAIGVVPLAFSSSVMLSTICMMFLSIVVVGCVHGLAVLPILLSILGPISTAPALTKKVKAGFCHHHGQNSSTTSLDCSSVNTSSILPVRRGSF